MRERQTKGCPAAARLQPGCSPAAAWRVRRGFARACSLPSVRRRLNPRPSPSAGRRGGLPLARQLAVPQRRRRPAEQRPRARDAAVADDC
eukprot:6289463-Prymnesium_polylepis.1